MSWCRWSSMNYQCDLYIYDDVGGYVSVHVAGRKKAWALLPDPLFVAMRPKWHWLFKHKAGGLVFRAWRALWDFERWITPWREVKFRGERDLQFTDMELLAAWLVQARCEGLKFPDYIWTCLMASATDSTYKLTASARG